MQADARTEVGQRCGLCSLADSAPASFPDVAHAIVCLGDDVIALVQPEVPGAIVAPRSHVANLAEAPRRGALLAALRRTALHVQFAYRADATRIEPTTSAWGSQGHACFHVAPELDERLSPPAGDPVAPARHLADLLRGDAASTSRVR